MSKRVLVMRKGWRPELHPRGGQGRFAYAPDTGLNPPMAAGGSTAAKEALQGIASITGILETGKSQIINNSELGDITLDKGETGKKGYGLVHIIEDRAIEGKSNDEIAAILYLVAQAAKEGKITREIPFRNNPDHKGRVELEKDGIIAILSRQRYQGDDEKWLLTGFDNNNKREEAAEAIKTVIAQYGCSPEFSGFRNQVGAAVSSLQKISAKALKKSMPRLMIKKSAAKAIMRDLRGRV